MPSTEKCLPFTDFFSGLGTYIWPSGRKYLGPWVNDERNGNGTQWLSNFSIFDKYEGSFKDGNYHGPGLLLWKDGTRYEGQFEKDKFNGFGTKYSNDGSIIHRGEWINNEPV